MPQREILHSDLNAFYASVEMLLDPDLRGKAVAVCGSTEERHGIVLAKSELAKRTGVKTGMVSWEARQLCPDLVFVKPQYDEYLKYSALVRGIYERFTDRVEPYGMDECWLDITNSHFRFASSMTVADLIRTTIKEEIGLTVSIGVSFNKIFAKLGSDMKKPDAITEITPDNFRELVWPLPASDLLYIGRATTRKLAAYGYHTIGDVAGADPEFLRRLLGINGVALWKYAAGLDESRVMQKDFVSPVKSVGHGITCVADLENDDEVFRVMLELAQDVGHRLRVHRLAAKGVEVWIRGDDLGGAQFQCRLDAVTQLPSVIAGECFRLFKERYSWSRKVRAVCVRAINLVPKETPEQTSLFIDHAKLERRERLEDAVEECRRRFGKHSVTYAALLGDKKMPEDGRDKVRMPGMMYS